ncbi:MAG TPA: prephenate dehydrogenase/arogenate dehydrogenase family protein [Xanthomonadaceae bacterium]|nr:prephenate dehydrogenase/arogenate dehydrogenase family protein [Xanthomonadaceae bacterium]
MPHQHRTDIVQDLQSLRAALDQVDADLVAKAAERQRIVAAIGQFKQRQGRQLRDYAREREVLERAAANARHHGIAPELAQALLLQLIEASLTSQEQHRLSADADGAGREALIIGGGGRMGRWFARFLQAQEWNVSVCDPAGSPEGFPLVDDWHRAACDADLVVVATPLRASAGILLQLATLKPTGVVLEIGSVKAPLAASLRALAKAQVAVVSLHPMFGPGANLLAGRHVICVDLGSERANELARGLFQATMATIVDMPLEAHDRLIAYVLGLSHALNIAFFSALAASHEDAAQLQAISSTTFDRQLAIAANVATENPDLYFEIQHLNPHGAEARAALRDALARLCAAADAEDASRFRALMTEGRRWLSELKAHRTPA